MARQSFSSGVPGLSHHKASGQAVVRLDGRDRHYGPWGAARRPRRRPGCVYRADSYRGAVERACAAAAEAAWRHEHGGVPAAGR